MTKRFFFFEILFQIFSNGFSMHFLGGSFTYQPNTFAGDSSNVRNIFVEIRLHISDHYFFCSPEQVNDHEILYLIGTNVDWDDSIKQYRWFDRPFITDKNFYRIQCISLSQNAACQTFTEDMWGYCESSNKKMGYSILIRRFQMVVERFKPIELAYSSCCWANTTDNKYFKFSLSIETNLKRINSSPYPYIPASYYVDINHPQDIKVFASDLDGDEILCEPLDDTLGGFLTIRTTSSCHLTYLRNRLGKQFGQFWIMDRAQNQILTRSLISVQIHVLDKIICNEKPNLFIRHGKEYRNQTSAKIKQDIYLVVKLQPNCLSIQPHDQTITELTTMCTNGSPLILADGGIEVIYQCKPLICGNHYVCFIGEFSLKLASTETKCFIIKAEGSAIECKEALKEFDYLTPRDRDFISEEPDTPAPMLVPITDSPSNKIVVKTSRSTTTTILPEKESDNKYLVLIFFVSLALLGLAGVLGWKFGLIQWIQQFRSGKQYRPSNSRTSELSDERSSMSVNEDENRTNQKPIEPATADVDTPTRIKVRFQQMKLGSLDEDEI